MSHGSSKESSFPSKVSVITAARVNSKAEVQIALIKLVLVIAFCFLQSDGFLWVLIMLLVITATIQFRPYVVERPYYN